MQLFFKEMPNIPFIAVDSVFWVFFQEEGNCPGEPILLDQHSMCLAHEGKNIFGFVGCGRTYNDA